MTPLLDNLDQLKAQLDALRPIAPAHNDRALQKLRMEWNYHSNAIEGNSLSLNETQMLLLHGLTAKGKPLKDHLDIEGHNQVLLYLNEIVAQNEPITQAMIRELHKILLKKPYEVNAIDTQGNPVKRTIAIGQYKTMPNNVRTSTGEMFYFASPEEVPAKMADLIDWLHKEEENPSLHPLLLAVGFHYKFVRIHPFDDGNGRMARILMNLILMRYGYPPAVVLNERRPLYLKALEAADHNDENLAELVEEIGLSLQRSLEIMLKAAKGESIDEPADLEKKLALIDKQLAAKEELKLTRKDADVNTVLQQSLSNLITHCLPTMLMFAKYFKSHRFEMSTQQESHSGRLIHNLALEHGVESICTNIKNTDFKNSNTVEITFQYQIFNKNISRPSSLSVLIRVWLADYNYSIQSEYYVEGKAISYQLGYHQMLSEEQAQEIAMHLGNYMVNQIEQLANLKR